MLRKAVGFVAVVSLLGGCAASTVTVGPVVSPTGIVYATGTPPVPTSRSQTATLYLRQDRLDRAL